MTDPLRSGRPPFNPEAPDRDRDARVEELLLTGLDHYFSGQSRPRHQRLDARALPRSRPRARARLHRARAQRHRRTAARRRRAAAHGRCRVPARRSGSGARTAASAVERGAGGEEAMALLQRLDRLEAAAQHVESGVATRPAPAARCRRRSRREPRPATRLTWIVAGVIAGFVASGAVTCVSIGDRVPRGLAAARRCRRSRRRAQKNPLPVPTASELSIARARALHARGHLRDALAALESVRPRRPFPRRRGSSCVRHPAATARRGKDRAARRECERRAVLSKYLCR